MGRIFGQRTIVGWHLLSSLSTHCPFTSPPAKVSGLTQFSTRLIMAISYTNIVSFLLGILEPTVR
jgi:hypothetical protein